MTTKNWMTLEEILKIYGACKVIGKGDANKFSYLIGPGAYKPDRYFLVEELGCRADYCKLDYNMWIPHPDAKPLAELPDPFEEAVESLDKKREIITTGWIATDKDGTRCLSQNKPTRHLFKWKSFWGNLLLNKINIDQSWENEPREVNIILAEES